MQLCDSLTKIPMNKIPKMLLPPSRQGPVPSKSCDWCPRTWSHLLVPLEENQWPWLQASGPASSWNQQGDRELCFLAVPPRCSWPVQHSDVEEEEEEEELPLVVPLLQASNGALSSFPLVPRSQSTEEAQWEAPPTLPLGKLHSPLLKHIFLRASVSGCHTAAPQWFCKKKKKKGTTANLKYVFTWFYSQMSTIIHM